MQSGSNPTQYSRHYRPHMGEARPLNPSQAFRRNDLTTPGSNTGDVVVLPTAGKVNIYGLPQKKTRGRSQGDFSNIDTVMIAIESVAAVMKRVMDYDLIFENTDNIKRVLKVRGKEAYKLPQTFYSLTGLENDRTTSPSPTPQRISPLTTVSESRVQRRAIANHFVSTNLTFHILRLQPDYNRHIAELSSLAQFAHWQKLVYEIAFPDGQRHYAVLTFPDTWTPGSVAFEDGSREGGVATLEFDVTVRTILLEREAVKILENVHHATNGDNNVTNMNGTATCSGTRIPGISTKPVLTKAERTHADILAIMDSFEPPHTGDLPEQKD